MENLYKQNKELLKWISATFSLVFCFVFAVDKKKPTVRSGTYIYLTGSRHWTYLENQRESSQGELKKIVLAKYASESPQTSRGITHAG